MSQSVAVPPPDPEKSYLHSPPLPNNTLGTYLFHSGPRKLKVKAILSFTLAFLSLGWFLRNQPPALPAAAWTSSLTQGPPSPAGATLPAVMGPETCAGVGDHKALGLCIHPTNVYSPSCVPAVQGADESEPFRELEEKVLGHGFSITLSRPTGRWLEGWLGWAPKIPN